MCLLNNVLIHRFVPANAVSILVLVDVPLEFSLFCVDHTNIRVSILVLVDVPLEFRGYQVLSGSRYVSILVLVDVPLESFLHSSYMDYLCEFQSLF